MNALNDRKLTSSSRPYFVRHASTCQRQQARLCSSARKLSHVGENGEVHTVDVVNKKITKRSTTTIGRIELSNKVASQPILYNNNTKGDVLGMARVAGIMVAKQSSTLIPLCHLLTTT